MLIVTCTTFGLAWWLGLYLLARAPDKTLSRRAGIGLLAYAVAVATELFEGEFVGRVQLMFVALPALAWSGVLIGALPAQWRFASALDVLWQRVWVPVAVLGLALAAAAGAAGQLPAAVLVLVPLIGVAVLLVATVGRIRPRARGAFLAVVTLMFGLGLAAILLPLHWLPSWFLLAGIGVDFLLLGFAVAAFDAFDEGELVLADMVRSLLTSGLAVLVFAGQVGAALAWTGRSPTLMSLLFGVIGTAVAVTVLASRIQRALDGVVFARTPRVRAERDELRVVAEALPRRAAPKLAALDEEEFVRLTRQALRHYGDLGKLVSNPLTELPTVSRRVVERGVADNSLERAKELKSLVHECVVALKPTEGDFGTADEWRHFNSLYFFYIEPVRPYRNYPDATTLSDAASRALRWFRESVPQRTLHNWQQAATKVVAMGLRDRGRQ